MEKDVYYKVCKLPTCKNIFLFKKKSTPKKMFCCIKCTVRYAQFETKILNHTMEFSKGRRCFEYYYNYMAIKKKLIKDGLYKENKYTDF